MTKILLVDWLVHWFRNALPVWAGTTFLALLVDHLINPKRPTLYSAVSYASAMFVACTLIQMRRWLKNLTPQQAATLSFRKERAKM